MRCLPMRRTPAIACPSSACSGGSNVLSALIPGARVDSISLPRRAASRRRAVISTSGNSGISRPVRMGPRLKGRLRAMGDRLAIVGGDAAGMSAATNARRRDEGLEIVAFERGPYTSYSACGIPYYVGDEVGDIGELIVRSPEQHRANGIDVRTGAEVVGLDLDRRRLTLRDGGVEPFDRLVLATGARAVPPPVPGAEATEPARTVDAAERFREQIEGDPGSAVVVGAGYIGLEM